MAGDPSADLNQPLRALLGESTTGPGAGRNNTDKKDEAASTTTTTSKVGERTPCPPRAAIDGRSQYVPFVQRVRMEPVMYLVSVTEAGFTVPPETRNATRRSE